MRNQKGVTVFTDFNTAFILPLLAGFILLGLQILASNTSLSRVAKASGKMFQAICLLYLIFVSLTLWPSFGDSPFGKLFKPNEATVLNTNVYYVIAILEVGAVLLVTVRDIKVRRQKLKILTGYKKAHFFNNENPLPFE